MEAARSGYGLAFGFGIGLGLATETEGSGSSDLNKAAVLAPSNDVYVLKCSVL